MKGGIVLALFAVDALRALKIQPTKRVVFLWSSDEEIGSESSRRAIEQEARRSDAVLVLEPSYGREGRLKTQRKGVGGAEIIVTGRSAHTGIDPEKGVNAVHELALQIARLMEMNDARRGITVQTTVVNGGTITNVVPEQARALVDIRYTHAADVPRINREATCAAANIERRAGFGDGWGGSSAAGADGKGAEIIRRGAGTDARDGVAAGGSVHGRRVGWEFYGGAGRADFGWVGRGGGWSA